MSELNGFSKKELRFFLERLKIRYNRKDLRSRLVKKLDYSKYNWTYWKSKVKALKLTKKSFVEFINEVAYDNEWKSDTLKLVKGIKFPNELDLLIPKQIARDFILFQLYSRYNEIETNSENKVEYKVKNKVEPKKNNSIVKPKNNIKKNNINFNEANQVQYIYCIKEREFIRLNEDVYKVGKTAKQNPNNRLSGYPKGSQIILVIKCNNCDTAERKMLKIFRKKFIQRKDIGNEYFEGKESDIMSELMRCFI